MFDFRQINDKLKTYCSVESMFDYYLLIDPKTFQVFKYDNESSLVEQHKQCFCYWEREEKCHNCILRHSYVKQSQYIKFEFINGKFFLVFGRPVEIDDKIFVMELIKDITFSMLGYNYYRADNKNIENIVSQFNELAVRDKLTGIYNINYINNYIQDFLKREIKNSSLVAGAIDIDNYTDINSLHGYTVGSEALQCVAGILEKCAISYGGMAGRLGPDEMAIFLTNVSEEEVENIFKELYDEVSKTPIKIQNKELNISFSFAIAKLKETDEPDEFISRLYFNLRKAQGRKLNT
ncbi:MAG: GGDEF domain-containing protein [Aminipila sp.]